MNIAKKLLTLPALGVMLVSCGSENNGNTMEQSFTNGFNYVVENATQQSFIDDEIGYDMKFDYDNMTVTVTIRSLQLSSNSSNVNFTLENLPFSMSEDYMSRIVSLPDIAVGATTRINNFRLTLTDRTLYVTGLNQYAYMPIINISYGVNNEYQVTAFMRSYLYVDNSTTVTTIKTGDVFRPKTGTQYFVAFDPKKGIAQMTIYGAVFAEAMEGRNIQMAYPELDVTFSSSGYSLSSASTIPTVPDGGKPVPYEEFKITDFSGSALLSGSFNINYECANRGNSCRVVSDLDYFTKASGN